jgi:hypothetical protein
MAHVLNFVHSGTSVGMKRLRSASGSIYYAHISTPAIEDSTGTVQVTGTGTSRRVGDQFSMGNFLCRSGSRGKEKEEYEERYRYSFNFKI